MQNKIKTFQEIAPLLDLAKRQGKKIVHCHGVFDLLHPGHIRHFQAAKEKGDTLVVTVTPDRFVNKGPGRPAFREELRLESLAALNIIDYVVLNDAPDGVSAIQKIRPHLYAKGSEYADHQADVTGKIEEEAKAAEKVGGALIYTEELTFSSSSLINRYFEERSPELAHLLNELKKEWSLESLLKAIESFKELRVLVVGDAIIDQYQYTESLGQSAKGHHLVARCLESETYLGGSLIIANHLAQFSDHVTLLTSVGEKCPHLPFINKALDSKVSKKLLFFEPGMTLTKKRYVIRDGRTLIKLFETYSTDHLSLNEQHASSATQFISRHSADFDLVLVADFGNGFTNHHMREALSNVPTFLALNTQTNSGNRGFNVVTHYKRADFISINEPELRLALHNRYTPYPLLVKEITKKLNAKQVAMTRGVLGVYCHSVEEKEVIIPALRSDPIDRVGAGDSFFSLASLASAKKFPMQIGAFLGSIAAALSVEIVGNKESIKKVALQKFLTRLMK